VAGVAESHGADAYGAHSAVPFVSSAAPVRTGEVYAAAVVLCGTPGEPDLPDVTVTPDGDVVVRWPDSVWRITLRGIDAPSIVNDPQ
jgi:hypothetical protein